MLRPIEKAGMGRFLPMVGCQNPEVRKNEKEEMSFAAAHFEYFLICT